MVATPNQSGSRTTAPHEMALRAVCGSLILHGLFVSLFSCWIRWDTVATSPREWHHFELASVLVSSEASETLEDFPLPQIIAPDGLPLESTLSELVTLPDAPEIAALQPGLAVESSGSGGSDFLSGKAGRPIDRAADRAPGGGFEGRLNPVGRAALLGTRGGTPESELAVARGLAWIVAHQLESGEWSLDHRQGACDGRCRDSGTAHTRSGATSLALLPLLGAGHTTQHGSYRPVVQKGLQSLLALGRDTPRGLDLHQGNMYAQGLAAIVLCENYAMTGDAAFREPAQRAIDFIVHAQHSAGGWRYFPRQPGDTTVFGWQLLALESARRAKLDVPPETFRKAARFLDAMQSADGSAFGYTEPGESRVPTAIGWLCRMYYGTTRRDERLVRGVERLRGWGVSKHDLYFDFHATQVLSQYAGHEWVEWNQELREHLVATQGTTGHELGSWHFPHEHASAGGRLYSTALATLTLEVYYRHLPLFTDDGESRIASRSQN